jgi:acyl-CoA synthetase (AMP-forming)/AMP-acid ligase II
MRYIAAYLGIMRAGCVAVPVNTRLDVASICEQLDLVGVRTVILGQVPAEIREALEDRYGVIELDRPGDVPTGPELPDVPAASVSSIMLTSGSTGRPKGVEHSHASLFHGVSQMAAAFPFAEHDRGVVFLPLYTCIPEQVLPTLCRGGSLEVLPGFDVDRVADACTRATTFDAVPTIMSRLLEHAPLHKMAGLRWILFASEPMPVHLLKSWWDALPGVETHQFYGMTELLTLTAAPHEMLRSAPGTVGRAFPGTRLSLAPIDLQADSGHEILASSHGRMRGYHGDPAATAGALTADGGLRTGDLGRIDERGLLYLTGRLKDIIISGGFNVAPAEIEAVAFTHGGVREVIVVGVPSDRWGETPVVVAVPKADHDVTPEALLRFCREALPGFKRPSAAALVPSLPTTGIGKGDKAMVRRLIADGVIPLVSA